MTEIAMLLLGGLVGWFGRYWAGRVERREMFDHRLRLEKEYQIYTELWEKLFEFRRAAHGFVDPLQQGIEGDRHQSFVDAFNAFQAEVRRNEPFIVQQVFEPARAIVSEGWAIVSASRRLEMLDQRRVRVRCLKADEQIADEQYEEDDNQRQAVQEIDRQFPAVKDAIRNRITLERRSASRKKA